MPRVAGSPIESTFTLADGVCVSNVWQTPGFLVHLDELFNEFSRCIVKIDRHSFKPRARSWPRFRNARCPKNKISLSLNRVGSCNNEMKAFPLPRYRFYKFSPARKNSSRSLEFLFNFIRVCAKRSRFNTLSPSIFHSICIEPFRNIREYFRIFRRIICLKNFIPN